MSTTGLFTTLTDELLAEIDAKTEKFVGFGIRSDTVARLVTELRLLRAENAELAKDAGRYCWIKAQGFATIRPANNKITLFTIASQHVDADTLDTAIDTAMAAQ